ncbi:putative bZIP transcription factor AP-1/Yap1 [Aspergillus saccharolyticus JOP 1030-1]|uniref:Putative bZIP transcription factor AP-1/Yap1 n=1 Tax=Aspergillus saccharolyticus JOP 1030-1 TaxID=1450539 RepID=A0A318ZQD1_9EURO|nr:putative bZIP transcription factor AP-1/Yap1 [Aspergillus saccharolyticus JOP 1030-1]PYH49257.1 putative bZIP transcription factor AP-1/Yap1 [Aspergillus saccharolyticus JOP 1030-1]
MADYNSLYQHSLYLSPDQQDLLLAALSSNNPPSKQQPNSQVKRSNSEPDSTPGNASSSSYNVSPGFDLAQPNSGTLGYADDESPFLDFNPELDFDYQGTENLIGELPGGLALPDEHEPGEKRKDMDGPTEENEGAGKKRRESDDKTAKKPGRKPLTSEPTSKRKAQNRAAQRAFRERKEKHLKDLETKVDELQKASDDANQENGLLRAQIERLQVELKEYRKRLSWVTSTNGLTAMNAIPGAYSKGNYNGLQNNDFMFDFPKFGDLPGAHIFNNAQWGKNQQNKLKNDPGSRNDSRVPGVLSRDPLNGIKANGSATNTPSPMSQSNGDRLGSKSATPKLPNAQQHAPSVQDISNSDSPSSSSDSHQSQFLSSSGTSPEPSVNSPAIKHQGDHSNCTYNGINGEESFCAQLGMACGNIKNPIPAVRHSSVSVTNTPNQTDQVSKETPPPEPALEMLAQQNGGQFDPVLFGDWREPQDAILSQDFGTFFDDAFPLPDLGSPSHNFSEVASQQPQQPPQPKRTLIDEIDSKLDEDEVVPGEDQTQMLSCTKIWYVPSSPGINPSIPTQNRDRLQSMEKFRNGELDVDNLCSELRMKARCSEGGVVVNQQDVEDIMGRAK